MSEILNTAAEENRTLDETESTEHDGLGLQVKSLDADLGRWREHERLQITDGDRRPERHERDHADDATRSISVQAERAARHAVRARRLREVGLQAATTATPPSMRRSAGAIRRRKSRCTSRPRSRPARSPMRPGRSRWSTRTSRTTSSSCCGRRPSSARFPACGTCPSTRRSPAQTAGGTYGWVGESKPKPVTKLAFASVSLGVTKVAGIIVLTQELVQLSNPSAEALVRADMIAGIAQFLDAQFIDPAVAAVAGVNPASITNGAPTAAATTNPMADIMGLISALRDQQHRGRRRDVHHVARRMRCRCRSAAISTARRSSPASTMSGGSYKGLTFITSQAAGTNVIALQPSLILYADDGGVTIDASRKKRRCRWTARRPRRPMRRPSTSRSGRPTRSACAPSGSSTGTKPRRTR